MCFLVLDDNNQKLRFYLPLTVHSKDDSVISNLQSSIFKKFLYPNCQTYFNELKSFSNLTPLQGVHLSKSFPVSRSQYIPTIHTETYNGIIQKKKKIYLTPWCVGFLDSHLVFLFSSTNQCPLYIFYLILHFCSTKYLYRRLEVQRFILWLAF